MCVCVCACTEKLNQDLGDHFQASQRRSQVRLFICFHLPASPFQRTHSSVGIHVEPQSQDSLEFRSDFARWAVCQFFLLCASVTISVLWVL